MSLSHNYIVKPGIYQHFKGNFYEVVAHAHNSETLEELVIYRALYGECGTWVRPAHMFLEPVVVNGETKSRFTYVSSQDSVAFLVGELSAEVVRKENS